MNDCRCFHFGWINERSTKQPRCAASPFSNSSFWWRTAGQQKKNWLISLTARWLGPHFTQPIECAPLISFFNQLPLKFNCLPFVLFELFCLIWIDWLLFLAWFALFGGAIGAAAPITHQSLTSQEKPPIHQTPAAIVHSKETKQIKDFFNFFSILNMAGAAQALQQLHFNQSAHSKEQIGMKWSLLIEQPHLVDCAKNKSK